MTRRTEVAEERKKMREPHRYKRLESPKFPFLFSSPLLPFFFFIFLFLFCETISWSEKGVCKGQISRLYDPLGSLPYSVVCVFGITLSDANIIPFTVFT